MNSRSFLRRLKRLETRLGTRKGRVLIEYYDKSPDGTLIRWPHPHDDETEPAEGDTVIRVIFVNPAGGQPLNRDGAYPA